MKHLIILPALLAISACGESGASYRPIVDGPKTVGFQSDLRSCQSLARNQKQFDRETMTAAAVGAGVGAILGEVDDDGNALGGALAGAVAGGASGAINADERRQAIVVECMRGRGHRVVG